jgi:outer membrane protein assembly factor BamB
MYAFEAATGRLLWRFDAAPLPRKIPVYGKLVSTWPVASGVVVEDGVAYFAAGIVNYDGVHVYALDAVSGSLVWQNNTSGHLNPEARTGVSVQGHLLIHDGRLYLAGGTSVSPAVYDLADGRCLNDPKLLEVVGSTAIRGQELYRVGSKVVVSGKPMYAHPDHPVYDSTVFSKMLHTSDRGRDVLWVNNSRIMCFNPIGDKVLDGFVSERPKVPTGRIAAWGRLNLQHSSLWEYVCEGSVAFARCKNAVLVGGVRPRGSASVEALDIRSGKRLWERSLQLQGEPVPWGMAMDGKGRVVVTIQGGAVMCFGPRM